MPIPRSLYALAAVALCAPLASARAQQVSPRWFVEGLGGAVVPTFDIADVAKTGAAYGATVGYAVSPRLVLMAEVDRGMHKDKATSSVDITTTHLMAKVGWSLTGPRDHGWETVLNLGVGNVAFDVDGAPSTYSYAAINAGAKIVWNVNRAFALVLSPQGDIAFSRKADLTTNNAWVWPFTAGLRVKF
jgi:hypothetical protein